MNVKEELLKALAETKENYTSGALLAEKLGVSRSAVWKAVKAVEAEGYAVESSAKGYRISENNNRLSGDIISSYLRTEYMGRHLKIFESIGSTNNYAKELASDGAENGTAVIADRQTAGRGRLGRSFVSPPGTGLYLSVIIRPDFRTETVPLITSAAACAAAEAAETLCGQTVNIKWVNDLYINGKKICGILTEASLGLEMKTIDYAVIGIGINVRKNDFGAELNKTASSIEEETGKILDRNQLCGEILNSLEKYLAITESREYLEEYRKREILTGNEITANIGRETIYGKAAGIDGNANLIVILSDGTEKHISSGEANLCRIKK